MFIFFCKKILLVTYCFLYCIVVLLWFGMCICNLLWLCILVVFKIFFSFPAYAYLFCLFYSPILFFHTLLLRTGLVVRFFTLLCRLSFILERNLNHYHMHLKKCFTWNQSCLWFWNCQFCVAVMQSQASLPLVFSTHSCLQRTCASVEPHVCSCSERREVPGSLLNHADVCQKSQVLTAFKLLLLGTSDCVSRLLSPQVIPS